MAYKSDIEIAQECTMAPITEVAAKAGIDDRYLEQYGKYKAKINYSLLKGNRYQSHSRGRGKDHHHRGAGGRPAENRQKIRGCPVWWRSTPSPQTQRRNWIWWSRNAGNWG